MIDRLEQRTHGADSAIDDEIAEPQVIQCGVCDERLPVRCCSIRDCPHVQREAA